MTTFAIDYNDPKYEDPMEEIYAIRREISEQCENDMHRIFETARESQRLAEAAGVKFIRLPVVHRRTATA